MGMRCPATSTTMLMLNYIFRVFSAALFSSTSLHLPWGWHEARKELQSPAGFGIGPPLGTAVAHARSGRTPRDPFRSRPASTSVVLCATPGSAALQEQQRHQGCAGVRDTSSSTSRQPAAGTGALREAQTSCVFSGAKERGACSRHRKSGAAPSAAGPRRARPGRAQQAQSRQVTPRAAEVSWPHGWNKSPGVGSHAVMGLAGIEAQPR